MPDVEYILITSWIVCVIILILLVITRENKMNGVLDALNEEDDEPIYPQEEDEKPHKKDISSIANQKRIRGEIRRFVLTALENLPKNYVKTEVKKTWGNKYRVNIVTLDSSGNRKFPLSYFIHYQKDNIMVDENTPIIPIVQTIYQENNNA